VVAEGLRGGVLYALGRPGAGERAESSSLLPGLSPSGLVFLSIEAVQRVAELTCPIQLVGARAPYTGVSLAEGQVVTVLVLGEPRALPPQPRFPGADRAVLCECAGERLALKGGEIVATGLFQPDPEGDGILWEGERVPLLDVGALYAQAEAALWTERAVTLFSASEPPTQEEAP
jgi:hypothetical protein